MVGEKGEKCGQFKGNDIFFALVGGPLPGDGHVIILAQNGEEKRGEGLVQLHLPGELELPAVQVVYNTGEIMLQVVIHLLAVGGEIQCIGLRSVHVARGHLRAVAQPAQLMGSILRAEVQDLIFDAPLEGEQPGVLGGEELPDTGGKPQNKQSQDDFLPAF